MKRTIRLTESDLRQVIKESVTKILKETSYNKIKHLYESYNDVECIEDEINISDTNGSDILFDYLYENNITDDIVSVKVYVDNEPYDDGDYYTPPSGGASYSHCEVDVDGKFKQILPDEIYSELVSAVEEYIDRYSDEYVEQVEDNNEWDPRDEYDPDDY